MRKKKDSLSLSQVVQERVVTRSSAILNCGKKKIVCQRETQNSDRDRDRGGIGSNEFCVGLVFGYVMELWIVPEGCKNLVSWSRQCGQDYPSSHAQG